MKSSSKREIFEDMLSVFLRGNEEGKQYVFKLLEKYVFQTKLRCIDSSDVGLHLLVPDILRILIRSNFDAPVSETIIFETYLPSGSTLSPYLQKVVFKEGIENLKEEIPFVVKNKNNNRYFLATRKYPMLVVGWFGKAISERKPSNLAFIYFVWVDQHRMGDVVSIRRKRGLLYKNDCITISFVSQAIKEIRDEIKETYKKNSQKWKEIRESPQKYGELKECENCGRDFLAHRTDTRSCPRSVCKKALSRKNKIRDYHRPAHKAQN